MSLRIVCAHGRRPISAVSASPLRLALCAILALGVSLTAAPPVRAATTLSVGLLGIDGSGASPELGPIVTDAIRKRIPDLSNVHVEVSPQDLIEIKLVFGCMEERPVCMAKVGKSLQVSRLIYGSLKRQPGSPNLTVSLKQLNVADATVEKFITESVPATAITRDSPQLDALVQQWLRTLLVEGLRGGLKVVSDPPGAMVLLDGVALGQAPISQNDVDVGEHVVRLDMPGYTSMVKTVEVRGGMTHEVNAQLADRSKLLGEKPKDTGPPPVPTDWSKVTRISSYVLGGLAGATAIAAIGTWRGYTSAEDSANASLDQLQRRLTESGQASGYRSFFTDSSALSRCGEVANLGGDADYQAYRGHCQRGNTLAGATSGLWVAAGAFAALSVTSAILSKALKKPDPKLRNENAGKRRAQPEGDGTAPAAEPPAAEPPASAPVGLRLDSLAPVVAPTGVAVAAQFSF